MGDTPSSLATRVSVARRFSVGVSGLPSTSSMVHYFNVKDITLKMKLSDIAGRDERRRSKEGGSSALVGAGALMCGAVRGRAGHKRGNRRPPVYRTGAWVLAGGSPVGDHDLRPILREFPPPGWKARRPLGQAPNVRRGARSLQPLFAGVWAGRYSGGTARREGRAGIGSGDRGAGGARHHLYHFPRGFRAEPRHGRVDGRSS